MSQTPSHTLPRPAVAAPASGRSTRSQTARRAEPDSGATSRSHWLRDPLLHFLVAGAALFALDAALSANRVDENTIVLSRAEDAKIHEAFAEARGRQPDATELEALRRRWFDNELLYREGLSLGLDRGDSAIRERVIFKALNLVQADLRPPVPASGELQSWFEQNRAHYDDPARVDLLEAVVEGKPERAQMQAFANALNDGAQSGTQAGLRAFRGRPESSIQEAFGEPFLKSLLNGPTGRWQVLDSSDGPRVVRLEARTEAVLAKFDEVHDSVLLDWRDRRMQELRTDAVRSLETKFRVQVAGEASR